MGYGRIGRWWVAVAVTIAVAGTIVTGTAGADPAATRVGADGTGLTLDGRPWWPAGMNAYQLGTDWSINAGCGGQVDLDAYFALLPSATLTRFNAFQALAVNKHTGALDFTALDRVFAAAQRHGQLLIPVLTAQDGACEDEVFKQRGWYVDGWRHVAAGAQLSFADWVDTAVRRWRDSPSVAAWELVGEPETGVCPDGDCAFENRVCPDDAAKVLRAFMDRAGDRVRALDPDRLITAGLTGGGQCGTAGDDYRYVGASENVDVLQYHDYHADGVPLPGDEWNGLAVRLEQAVVLNKPLLVAEIGQSAGGGLSVARRAADVVAKIAGQRAAGTAGALMWSFVPDARTHERSYDIGAGDPLFAVLARHTTVGAAASDA
ncbi:beta-mannosidase [Rhodococcus sp. NPDC058514]|uniref:beta-mannosidase n=1 Tax=unclassified Rhodococcus (in: high G+C Gram-positive bacteria) TaxID=192944 RepID=UPI003647A7E7